MECKKVEELLSEYIDNELPREVHDEVFHHLEKCLPCGMLKEEVEELMSSFCELEEEVPFFVKNRLYYISETELEDVIEFESPRYFLQWVAAVIGTFLLFLNLFYFTNIYPSANRTLHNVASELTIIAVKTEAIIEKVKASKDELFVEPDEDFKEITPVKTKDKKPKT